MCVSTFPAFTCSHNDESKVLLRHGGHYIWVEILAIHSSLYWTLMVNGYIGTVLTKQKFWFVVTAACIGTIRGKLLIRHRGCMYRQYKWTCSWMGNFLLWPKYMKHIFNRMLGSLSEPSALYHCNYLHPEILYPKQLGLLLPVVAPILNCTWVGLETQTHLSDSVGQHADKPYGCSAALVILTQDVQVIVFSRCSM